MGGIILLLSVRVQSGHSCAVVVGSTRVRVVTSKHRKTGEPTFVPDEHEDEGLVCSPRASSSTEATAALSRVKDGDVFTLELAGGALTLDVVAVVRRGGKVFFVPADDDTSSIDEAAYGDNQGTTPAHEHNSPAPLPPLVHVPAPAAPSSRAPIAPSLLRQRLESQFGSNTESAATNSGTGPSTSCPSLRPERPLYERPPTATMHAGSSAHTGAGPRYSLRDRAASTSAHFATAPAIPSWRQQQKAPSSATTTFKVFCGEPRRDGLPCQWRVLEKPCPHHSVEGLLLVPRCGRPTKKGEPCKWDISREACPWHY